MITHRHNESGYNIEQFYKKALVICKNQKRPFSFKDFGEISPENFRQYIYKSKEMIEVVRRGRPTLYKVIGIEMSGDSHRITNRVTGVNPEFEHLLESLRDQPPMMHDIHVKFESDLHSKLVLLGLSVNPSNHAIENIRFPSSDNNITIKILVYPKTTQIIIGCTYKPIIYDESGIWSLFSLLSEVRFYLSGLTNHMILVPEVRTWIVTRFDFNKDGSQSVSGKSFSLEIQEVSSGLVRFYLKKMQNGERIPRLEQTRTPNKTISNIMEEILSN